MLVAYEILRRHKIARNEKRMAELGLGPSSGTTSIGGTSRRRRRDTNSNNNNNERVSGHDTTRAPLVLHFGATQVVFK